jgi:hypothetical protein
MNQMLDVEKEENYITSDIIRDVKNRKIDPASKKLQPELWGEYFFYIVGCFWMYKSGSL